MISWAGFLAVVCVAGLRVAQMSCQRVSNGLTESIILIYDDKSAAIAADFDLLDPKDRISRSTGMNQAGVDVDDLAIN